MRVLYIPYGLWKSVVQANSLAVFEQVTAPDTQYVWAGSKEVVYRADVSPEDFSDYEESFPTRTGVTGEDEAIARILNLALFLSAKSLAGVPKFTVVPPDGTSVGIVSPNWCDPCTWYASSSRVEEATLSDQGDGLLWGSDHTYWIDVKNGRITHEDELVSTYGVVVTKNDVVLTESALDSPNEDYLVNYETGEITLSTAAVGATIKATYSYKNGSLWTLAPTAGKKLRLTAVEAQFSEDIEINATTRYEVWGYVDVFAPSLLTTASPPGPYPPGTRIPLKTLRYKTLMDFVNEAQRSFPMIPALGGSSRGMSTAIHIFQWPYQENATRDLLSSVGMEIRISIEGDQPFGGAIAIVAAHGTSEDE